MSATLEVHYTRDGSRHQIITGNRALGDILIETENVPVEERNGTAKQLLGSATLFCYCSSLVSAMDARGLKYKNLRGTATLHLAKNEKAQSRIQSIDITVRVEIDEEDFDTFERIQKIMKNGCLVTASLHEGVHMNYNLIADYEDE